MLRLVLTRALLATLPFMAWFIWREWARRSGRAMGSTPWAWLFAGAAVLVGASLLGAGLFHRDNRGEVYVPAEVTAGGRVSPGHFEPAPAAPR